MKQVSLDCPFLYAPSIFAKVYMKIPKESQEISVDNTKVKRNRTKITMVDKTLTQKPKD